VVNTGFFLMNKIVLLISAFFLISCSSNQIQYAGKVNKSYISLQEYMIQLKKGYETFVMQNGFTPTEYEKTIISEKTWNSIIEGAVLRQEFEKYGIIATAEEVYDSLLLNIPDLFRNSPVFNENDTFRYDIYESSVRSNKPVDLSWIFSHYINWYIPSQKLRKIVTNDFKPDEKLIKKEFQIKQYEGDITSYSKLITDFSYEEILPSEVRKYYENNIQRYAEKSKIDFDYLLLDIKPSENDIKRAKIVIDSIYKDLSYGIPFSYMAEKCSDSKSSKDNGSIGYVKIDSLNLAVKKELLVTEENKYTKPINIGDSWVILYIEKKYQNTYKLLEIVKYPKISSTTKDEYFDKANELKELIVSTGIIEAANQFDLTIKTAVDYTNNDIKELSEIRSLLLKMLYDSSMNYPTDPIFLNNLSAYLITIPRKVIKAGYKEFDKVKDSIIEELIFRKKVKNAELILSQIDRDGIKVIRNDVKWDSLRIEKFSLKDTLVLNEQLRLKVIQEIINKKKVITILSADKAYILLSDGVLQKYDAAYDSQREDIIKTIMQDEKNKYFDKWLEKKIKQANVKDWRKQIMKTLNAGE